MANGHAAAGIAPLVVHARDLFSLFKPGITLFNTLAAACGLLLGGRHTASWTLIVAFLVGVASIIAGANAFNCFLERDIDEQMARTRDRPLPARRLPAHFALGVGLALTAFSLPVLWHLVNPLTCMLGVLGLAGYVLVYTPLKRVSPHALVIGAVPGAVPPVMGWTAARGEVELPAIILFLVLFAWQMPHFIAISIYRHKDYTRAGLPTVSVAHGPRRAFQLLVAWSVVQLGVATLPAFTGMAGEVYLAVASAFGVAFLAASVAGLRSATGGRWARRVFLMSVAYLPVLLGALVIDAR